jgi:hypothetical protein
MAGSSGGETGQHNIPGPPPVMPAPPPHGPAPEIRRGEAHALALGHVLVVAAVERGGGRDLLDARRDLDALRARLAARPVLERHARVPQVRVLERDHLVPCNTGGVYINSYTHN